MPRASLFGHVNVRLRRPAGVLRVLALCGIAWTAQATIARPATAQAAGGSVPDAPPEVAATGAGDAIRDAAQHLVVVVGSPDATRGMLHRYENIGEEWSRVGDPVPVVVGRSGVGPKREGDGRSPRGAFALGTAFGYASEPPRGLSIPYRPMLPGTVCVDDPASPHYNRIMDPMGPEPEWESAEAMRRDLVHGDDLYELGVVVEYNAGRTPGAGSCIFLHVWRDGDSPTAGCTAMAERDLRALLAWLDPAASPALIQGSHRYFANLEAEGRLPYTVPGPSTSERR